MYRHNFKRTERVEIIIFFMFSLLSSRRAFVAETRNITIWLPIICLLSFGEEVYQRTNNVNPVKQPG